MSSTIEVLKQLIQLEEKRATLQQELASLDSKAKALKQGLSGGAPTIAAPVVKVKGKPGRKPGSKNKPKPTVVAKPVAAPVAKAPAAKAPTKSAMTKAPALKTAAKSSKAPAKSAKGFERGALVDSIKAALKEAGAKGATIKDLASKLKSEYRNIQVWFATTGKKHTDIKKIAPATYRLK